MIVRQNIHCDEIGDRKKYPIVMEAKCLAGTSVRTGTLALM